MWVWERQRGFISFVVDTSHLSSLCRLCVSEDLVSPSHTVNGNDDDGSGNVNNRIAFSLSLSIPHFFFHSRLRFLSVAMNFIWYNRKGNKQSKFTIFWQRVLLSTWLQIELTLSTPCINTMMCLCDTSQQMCNISNNPENKNTGNSKKKKKNGWARARETLI